MNFGIALMLSALWLAIAIACGWWFSGKWWNAILRSRVNS